MSTTHLDAVLKQRGLTALEVAEATGLHRNTLSRMRHGRGKAATWSLVAAWLGEPVELLKMPADLVARVRSRRDAS